MSLEEFVAHTKSNNIGVIVAARKSLAASGGNARGTTTYRQANSAKAAEAIVQPFGAHDPVLSDHPLIAEAGDPT